FSTGGSVQLNVLPFDYADGKANLDVLAQIYDGSGRLVATSNPSDQLYASFNLTLPAGNYYLLVDGTGKAGAYSDYGSLGPSSLTGTISAPPPVDRTGPQIVGGHFGPGLIELDFNEAMNWSSFSVADIVSFTSPTGADLRNSITSITFLDNSVYIRFNMPAQA